MAQRRVRARELGLDLGGGEPGPLDAITDVAGIRVGQVTVRDGAGIRTGVTAIVPDQVDRAGGQLPAGLFVGNGYGKLIGATQLAELGVIETPVLLTGTLSAFRAADALVTYMLGLPGNAVRQPRRGRDERRIPVRHPGQARHRAARAGRDLGRARRAGG